MQNTDLQLRQANQRNNNTKAESCQLTNDPPKSPDLSSSTFDTDMSNPYQANPDDMSISQAYANLMGRTDTMIPTGLTMTDRTMTDPDQDPDQTVIIPSQYRRSELESAQNHSIAGEVSSQSISTGTNISGNTNQIHGASNLNADHQTMILPTQLAGPQPYFGNLQGAGATQGFLSTDAPFNPGWNRPGESIADLRSKMAMDFPLLATKKKNEYPPGVNHPNANSGKALGMANLMRRRGSMNLIPKQLQLGKINSAQSMMKAAYVQRLNKSNVNQVQVQSNVNPAHAMTMPTAAQHLNTSTGNAAPQGTELMSLPTEIHYNIQTYLDHPSLLNLAATNNYFRSLCPEPKIKQSLLCFEKCSLLNADNVMVRKHLLPCYTCHKGLPACEHFPEVKHGDKYKQIEIGAANAGMRSCATCIIKTRPGSVLTSPGDENSDWVFKAYVAEAGRSKILGGRHGFTENDLQPNHYWIHCVECDVMKRYMGSPFGRKKRYDEAYLEGDMCAACYQPVWDEENKERKKRKNEKARQRYKEKKEEAKRRKEEMEKMKKAGRVQFTNSITGLEMWRFVSSANGNTSMTDDMKEWTDEDFMQGYDDMDMETASIVDEW